MEIIMETPYIKHLQLGMSVDEFVNEFTTEHIEIISNDGDTDWWKTLVKILVESKDHNIKFVFDDEGEYSTVYAPKIPDLGELGYDYDNWGGAEEDSISLNKFIKDFYGTKNKTYKAKIDNKQYVKKRAYCPCCGSKKTRQDGGLYFDKKNKVVCTVGCDDCNAQWSETYKLTGFQNLGSR